MKTPSDPSDLSSGVKSTALPHVAQAPSGYESGNPDPRPEIPDHELLRRIGAGSYGEV